MGQLRVELRRGSPRVKGAAAFAAAPLLAALLACAAFSQGCASVNSASKDGRPAAARPLADAEPSPEALANRVLATLASGDSGMMNTYRLTKDEFCRYVFPELPASKLNNVTCDWVWSQATLKSQAGTKVVIGKHLGRRYRLVSIRYLGKIDTYPSFRVYNKPIVTVVDEQGQQHEYRLFGSLLELDGQYKLFSYVVD